MIKNLEAEKAKLKEKINKEIDCYFANLVSNQYNRRWLWLDTKQALRILPLFPFLEKLFCANYFCSSPL